jgi:glucose/arabinose dehydrogenase
MNSLRAKASYLAAISAVVLPLHGCGSGDGAPAGPRAGNCPEIFASGLRNPWRWSFDRQTGQLWVGDVGQSAREEVDRLVLGGNYGWRCLEGTRLVGLPCGSEPDLLPPVAEYERSVGTTVTGGYVYRGTAIPSLIGQYVFGDFGSSRIWHIDGNSTPTVQITGGFNSTLSISSFGEDNDGELYILHYAGQLYRLTGDIAVQRFTGLNFTQPVAMLQAPGDRSRWFVVEQAGRVRVFDNDPAVASFATFVDLGARVAAGAEMGLLGMAFHPSFPADPRVFLSYTNEEAGRVSRVSEFRSSDGGTTLDPGSERIVLTVSQPEANHNGGNIAFGPDGYLYLGLGDGGGGNDQHGTIGNGQLLTTLLGKMLRIDVNGALPYAIPPGNPYAGNELCGADS